jgi:hypothetical protein
MKMAALEREHAKAVTTKALHEVFFHLFYRTILRLGRLLFIFDIHIKEGIVRASGLLGLARLSEF